MCLDGCYTTVLYCYNTVGEVSASSDVSVSLLAGNVNDSGLTIPKRNGELLPRFYISDFYFVLQLLERFLELGFDHQRRQAVVVNASRVEADRPPLDVQASGGGVPVDDGGRIAGQRRLGVLGQVHVLVEPLAEIYVVVPDI